MVFDSRKSLLVIFLSIFLQETLSEYFGDQTKHQLSTCNDNANFPVPPCCGVASQLRERIFGKKKSELNEFPWLVYIHIDMPEGNVFSGGSLINSRWVISTAHSFNGTSARTTTILVHLGEWNITADLNCNDKLCKPKAKVVQVDNVIIHELYKVLEVPEHDLALLHLAESVTFTDYIKPICLPINTPDNDNFANKMAVVAGWGITETGLPSNVLLKASQKVWSWSDCKEYATNDSIHICAGGLEGAEGPCTGDSGGPLMLQLANDLQSSAACFQIGVVSFGPNGCGRNPSLYTNISTYIKWIKHTIMKFH